MNKKKSKPQKKEKDFFIRQVSKFSLKRLHIEIPTEHTKNFKPGDYAEVRKIRKTSFLSQALGEEQKTNMDGDKNWKEIN